MGRGRVKEAVRERRHPAAVPRRPPQLQLPARAPLHWPPSAPKTVTISTDPTKICLVTGIFQISFLQKKQLKLLGRWIVLCRPFPTLAACLPLIQPLGANGAWGAWDPCTNVRTGRVPAGLTAGQQPGGGEAHGDCRASRPADQPRGGGAVGVEVHQLPWWRCAAPLGPLPPTQCHVWVYGFPTSQCGMSGRGHSDPHRKFRRMRQVEQTKSFEAKPRAQGKICVSSKSANLDRSKF